MEYPSLEVRITTLPVQPNEFYLSEFVPTPFQASSFDFEKREIEFVQEAEMYLLEALKEKLNLSYPWEDDTF